MKSAILAAACLMLLVALASSQSDLVISRDSDQLLYTTSQVFPNQIAVINDTTNVGVVVDTEGEKISLFNGDDGQGVIIDSGEKIGIQIERGGWHVVQSTLKDYIKDCNVTQLVYDNSDGIFELESQNEGTQVWGIARKILGLLGHTILGPVMNYVNLFTGIIKEFSGIIYAIKRVLRPVLNMATPIWMVFQGGFMGLLNIFKFLGNFFSSVIGGLPALVKKSVRFTLSAIIAAANGARVFFQILKGLAKVFNLMSLIPTILQHPMRITKFIVGFGGNMLKGITGLFGIVSKLFSFTIKSITSAVQYIVGLLLSFFRCKRPSVDDVDNTVDDLLSVSAQQAEMYPNPGAYNEYNNYLLAYKGEGDYQIKGVKLAPFVKVIITSASSVKDVTMKVLDLLNPVVPTKSAVPHLLVHMIKSLNTTDGPSYIKQIMPSIQIPKEGLHNLNKNISENIWRFGKQDSGEDGNFQSPPDLFRNLPVVGEIYNELDEASKVHHKVSLDNLLQREHIEELMDFTTTAFGLTN